MKPTLGVFGFGQFMKFFTPYLRDYFDIIVYDREEGKNEKRIEDIRSLGVRSGDIIETASADYVLLGYPAGSIADLVKEIAQYITRDSVVFDVCSVKIPAVTAMLKYLPKECNIIATHPIFGPQSGKKGIIGLKCVFSNVRCDQDEYVFLKNIFGEKLGLEIPEMTAEEHDKEMAYVHVITHFIGRSLKKIGIPESDLATCSYKDLRDSSETVGYDSDELFLSIQQDNPYASEVRNKLLQEFQDQQNFIEDNAA